MIYKCSDNDKEKIFSYIGENYKNCLYAYADLKQYSLKETFVNAWLYINHENTVKALIFNYHNGAHVFAKDLNFDVVEVSVLLKTLKLTMINARKEIIEILEPYFDTYKYDFGHIMEQNRTDLVRVDGIEVAEESDFHDMAEMLCSDYGIGAGYTIEEMESQLIERYTDKYGRNYILRKDGHIVAQASTGAEVSEFAMVVYVIVSEKYRRKGYATRVMESLCYDLRVEGKKTYLVCYEESARLMYEKLGFKVCSDWGKLYYVVGN